jgi:hypothetical protein
VVVNGTSGAAAAGQSVLLRAAAPSGEVAERVAATDEAGWFGFDGLAEGSAYQVLVRHERVVYQTAPFELPAAPEPVELRVYDTTDRDPGLRAERVVLVLDQVDERRMQLVAHQAVTLTNPSAQTYVATQSGGPMSLVRFALPPGARDLTPTFGLRTEELVQVDRGFAALAPVPPGTNEYGFSYRFPYEAGTYAFTLSLPYGADDVRVLAPPEGPAVRGPQLRPAEEATLDGRRYRAWAASGVPAGGRLELELGSLPAAPVWVRLVAAVARPWAPALVLGGVLLMVLARALRPSVRQAGTVRPTRVRRAGAAGPAGAGALRARR